jgi:hypothetical protein
VQVEGGGWVNDDTGGQTCEEADDAKQRELASIVVTPTQDELNLMMLQSVGQDMSSPVQLANVGRHGLEAAMAAEGARSLATLVRGGFGALYDLWSATRLVPASLEALAEAGGPTIDIVTSQTGTIDAARGLHAGIGEGAEALAKSFRPEGTISRAKVPVALIKALQNKGLAQVSLHANGAKEVFFKAEAVKFILRFFK